MHQLLRYGLAAVLFFSMTSAGVINNETGNATTKPIEALTKSEIRKLSREQMEVYLGRAMTGLEKVAFKMNRKKFVKYVRNAEEGKVNTLAIVSLATCWIPPVGLVFGILALGQLKKRRNETGRGMAWTAIVINGLFLLILLGMAAFPG